MPRKKSFFSLRRLARWLFSSGNDYVVSNFGADGRPIYQHRIIAEAKLGRKLMPGEVVHHINARKNDNRVSNLCVMTYENHERYHAWFDWIVATYGNKPKLSTSKRKLQHDFGGIILEQQGTVWITKFLKILFK